MEGAEAPGIEHWDRACLSPNVGLISGHRASASESEKQKVEFSFLQRTHTQAHWLVHLGSICIIGLLVMGLAQHEPPSTVLRTTEGLYTNLQITLAAERRSMDPRIGPDRVRDQSWMGPFNERNVGLWQNITTLGVLSISEKEYDALGMQTSRANSTGEHFIVPQMFHDLHCLKRIRESYWTVGRQLQDHDRHHLDHCVEIFRRNIMCAADLSPYPFHWGGEKHEADYDVIRECRAWDPIYTWSLSRNTTGYVL